MKMCFLIFVLEFYGSGTWNHYELIEKGSKNNFIQIRRYPVKPSNICGLLDLFFCSYWIVCVMNIEYWAEFTFSIHIFGSKKASILKPILFYTETSILPGGIFCLKMNAMKSSLTPYNINFSSYCIHMVEKEV